MSKGTLYGVGVGPGDPELLTLKAVDVIRRCPVVAAPRTGEGATVALDIVRGAVDLGGKQILELDFSMKRDKARREAAHEGAARRLADVLDQGLDVAMLNLGDVSVYASFQYMNERLVPLGYPVVMVPGVPSFCAAAAALGRSLTEMNEPLFIIPASAALAEGPGTQRATRVYMKSGRGLATLLAGLKTEGRLADAALIQNVGMENQRVFRNLEQVEQVRPDYFSLVIVKGAQGGYGNG